MQTYIDWMNSCSLITLTGHPALSLPCGFSEQGLPVGLQIVGRYRDEQRLLAFAHALESITVPTPLARWRVNPQRRYSATDAETNTGLIPFDNANNKSKVATMSSSSTPRAQAQPRARQPIRAAAGSHSSAPSSSGSTSISMQRPRR